MTLWKNHAAPNLGAFFMPNLLRRDARKKQKDNEPHAPFVKPFCWVITAGRPSAVMAEPGITRSSDWPPGVYFFATTMFRTGIIVASVRDHDLQSVPWEASCNPGEALGFLATPRGMGRRVSGGSTALRSRSSCVSTDCLTPSQRETYLLESPADARSRYEENERKFGRTPRD